MRTSLGRVADLRRHGPESGTLKYLPGCQGVETRARRGEAEKGHPARRRARPAAFLGAQRALGGWEKGGEGGGGCCVPFRARSCTGGVPVPCLEGHHLDLAREQQRRVPPRSGGGWLPFVRFEARAVS